MDTSCNVTAIKFYMYYINVLRTIYYVENFRNRTERHWRQLTIGLTGFFYLWPDLQTTSLIGVVYVCFDRRTTALTLGS